MLLALIRWDNHYAATLTLHPKRHLCTRVVGHIAKLRVSALMNVQRSCLRMCNAWQAYSFLTSADSITRLLREDYFFKCWCSISLLSRHASFSSRYMGFQSHRFYPFPWKIPQLGSSSSLLEQLHSTSGIIEKSTHTHWLSNSSGVPY